MIPMKTASIRDLRYNFRNIEHLLKKGEEVQITKRGQVIARLLPPPPAPKRTRRKAEDGDVPAENQTAV